MGSKYTKGQADATAKYMQDKHTIRVVTPKEKADEYKAEAVEENKSLNQFIVDCVDNEIKAKKGGELYTHEIAELLGEVYHGILKVLNKKGNDPYYTISDRYPFKCLAMLLPRTFTLGIPSDLDIKINKLMNTFDVDDIEKLMAAPMPMEYIMDFHKGMMSHNRVGGSD